MKIPGHFSATINTLWLERVGVDAGMATDIAEQIAASFAASLMVHLILSDLGSGDEATHRRKIRMDWIDARLVGARLQTSDKRFLNQLADLLTEMTSVSQTDELAFRNEADPEDIRRVWRVWRRRLFEILPQVVQEALLNRPAFAEGLGIEMQRSVTIEGDTFSDSDLWPEVQRALLGAVGSAINQHSQVFKLSKASNGSIQFDGPSKFAIFNSWFSVIGADGDNRANELARYLDFLDLMNTERADAVFSILNASHASELASSLRSLESVSVRQSYDQIQSRFFRGESLPVRDVLPPLVASALHYLRLNPENGSVSSQVSNAWFDLEQTFGAQEAFDRLGTLPINLTEVVAPALDADSIEKIAPDPMHGLHIAAALSKLDDEKSSVTVFRDFLENCRTRCVLLVKLLRWTERAYRQMAHWRELPTDYQLALVWSHAAKITALMLQAGDLTQEAVDEFEPAISSDDPKSLFWWKPTWEGDCAAPMQVELPILVFVGLEYVFGSKKDRELPAGIEQLALEQVSTTSSSSNVPSALLLLLDAEAPDALSSIFGSAVRQQSNWFCAAQSERDSFIAQCLNELGSNPMGPGPWQALVRLLRTSKPLIRYERLKEILNKLDMTGLVKKGGEPAMMRLLVEVCCFETEADLCVLVEKALSKFAEAAAEILRPGAFSTSHQQAVFEAVLESAVIVSRRSDSGKAVEHFCRLVLELAARWPTCAISMRWFIARWLQQLPTADTAPVHETLLKLRAMI
jgi:hypothetical protein